jgi:hypothetical protein
MAFCDAEAVSSAITFNSKTRTGQRVFRAKVNIKGYWGLLLQVAATQGYVEVVQLLVEYGADLEAKDNGGRREPSGCSELGSVACLPGAVPTAIGTEALPS